MVSRDSFEYEPPEERIGRRKRLEGKEEGSYLRLIPGLCLEDKMYVRNIKWY